MATLVIGNQHDQIVITILGRSYPDAQDYWDGNWVNARIDVRVGAWRASYQTFLRVPEFITFREQLEAVYATLQGEACFASLEHCLDLSLKADSLGHIAVEGAACDTPDCGNKLVFRLPELDQTYLPAILNQLRDIECEVPLRGKPED